MSIVTFIDKNDYNFLFITATISGKETFNGSVFKHGEDYSVYAKDKSDRTHGLEIRRERKNKGFNQFLPTEYYDTYCVGYGGGAFIGWELNLSKRAAFAIARGMLEILNTNEMVAQIYITNIDEIKNKFG